MFWEEMTFNRRESRSNCLNDILANVPNEEQRPEGSFEGCYEEPRTRYECRAAGVFKVKSIHIKRKLRNEYAYVRSLPELGDQSKSATERDKNFSTQVIVQEAFIQALCLWPKSPYSSLEVAWASCPWIAGRMPVPLLFAVFGPPERLATQFHTNFTLNRPWQILQSRRDPRTANTFR